MSDIAISVQNLSKHDTIEPRPHAAGWLAAWIVFANLVYVTLYWPTFLDLLRSLHRVWLTW